jgi:hypothetical protein
MFYIDAYREWTLFVTPLCCDLLKVKTLSLLSSSGEENSRQIHNIGLRSAYDWTSVAGEPLYTTSCPGRSSSTHKGGGGKHGVGCHDYIFYSRAGLEVKRVLLPPPLSQLIGRENPDPNHPFTSPDNYWSSHNGSIIRPFGSLPLPLRSSGVERFTVPDKTSMLSITDRSNDDDNNTDINSDMMNVLEIASARRKLQRVLDLSKDFTGYRPIIKVSFIICILTLLLMPLAGLHFCVGLDFVTPSLQFSFKYTSSSSSIKDIEEKQKYGKKKEILHIGNNKGPSELWLGE